MTTHRKKPDKPRVLCIGWHKTGTSTLGAALLRLGYSVLGCRLDTYYSLTVGDTEAALRTADPFDALQDVPWAALYEALDARYPGSKFILTVRDDDSWLRSASRHFGATPIPLHGWLYGEPSLEGNEELYLARYRRHNENTRCYFADRPNDLLVMDLAAGDGWPELCTFLDEPVPAAPFPRENAAPASLRGNPRLRFLARTHAPAFVRTLWFKLKLAYLQGHGFPDPRNRFNNFPQNRIEIAKYTAARRAKKN
jgi:hypothetical protein